MSEFDGLSKGLLDELNLSNRQFKDWLGNLDIEVNKFNEEIKKRKSLATILKLIVVIIGIIIVTGFLLDWVVQALGAIVSLIVAVERIITNVDKLLSIVAARGAYNRIRREVVKIHTSKIGSLVGLKSENPEEAAKKIIQLQATLRNKLIDIDNDIKTNLENKNYELLGRLVLEDNNE